MGAVGELEGQPLPTPGEMCCRICRWAPQGSPCTLSPGGALLHHVNENKYGDCDISRPLQCEIP